MNKLLRFILITTPFIVAYIFLSSLISTSQWIWYENRLFGLLSYTCLFLTVIIGELRVIQLDKSEFKLFEYHIPIGIFATFMVSIHFISAIFDKYKWGTHLTFSQYLGFSFSDKWLTFLSLGTLAFYFMIIIGVTSINKMIRFIGFKRWKIIHYISYVSFLFAYLHSVNLGTDIKTSVLSVIFKPLFSLMFWLVIALLIVRVMVSFKIFVEQLEITLMTILMIIIVIGAVFFTGFFYKLNTNEIIFNNSELEIDISYYEVVNDDLQQKNELISEQIDNLRGDSNERNI